MASDQASASNVFSLDDLIAGAVIVRGRVARGPAAWLYPKPSGSRMDLSKEHNVSLVGTASPTTGSWLCWFHLDRGLLGRFAAARPAQSSSSSSSVHREGWGFKDLPSAPFSTSPVSLPSCLTWRRGSVRQCNGVSEGTPGSLRQTHSLILSSLGSG